MPTGFLQGIVFFVLLVSLFFLVFCEFFWFLDSEAFIGYRAAQKQKNLKKTKKTKETKVLGEMLCPRVSSRGLFCFFLFLCSFCFLRVCLVFDGFWFMNLCGICPT